MKEKAIRILELTLKLLAWATLVRYRPAIVGITGSAGKTTAKFATAAALKGERFVRVAGGNFNNELGLPLSILGNYTKISGFFFWPRVIARAIWKLISRGSYPEILILEYGIDRPGDMKKLLEIAKPGVGIVTAIGEIPVHVEFFAGPEAVAREKARLLEALPAAGFAALNYDDATAAKMRDRTRARNLTYGFGEGADIRIVNFETRSERDAPPGISFKLEYGGSYVPVRLDGVFGKAHAYAAAAGACVGLVFGVNLVKIAEGLNLFYKPMRGRMMLLPGIKESWIIDDSYNASPLAMHAALDTLRDIKAKRKVAVLGDMLEIGHYTVEAHEEIGRLAAGVVNFLVTVGPRGKFIAYATKKYGLPRRNIISFDTADEARLPVQELIRKGDVVLVKASRAIQLEKVVMEIELPKAVQNTIRETKNKIGNKTK